jgi:hypothetical protein
MKLIVLMIFLATFLTLLPSTQSSTSTTSSRDIITTTNHKKVNYIFTKNRIKFMSGFNHFADRLELLDTTNEADKSHYHIKAVDISDNSFISLIMALKEFNKFTRAVQTEYNPDCWYNALLLYRKSQNGDCMAPSAKNLIHYVDIKDKAYTAVENSLKPSKGFRFKEGAVSKSRGDPLAELLNEFVASYISFGTFGQPKPAGEVIKPILPGKLGDNMIDRVKAFIDDAKGKTVNGQTKVSLEGYKVTFIKDITNLIDRNLRP